jgi:hypothetical protein
VTPTARGAHCVATDGKDAYVCDPNGGRILIVHDSKQRGVFADHRGFAKAIS